MSYPVYDEPEGDEFGDVPEDLPCCDGVGYCETCGGHGTIDGVRCDDCFGQGFVLCDCAFDTG